MPNHGQFPGDFGDVEQEEEGEPFRFDKDDFMFVRAEEPAITGSRIAGRKPRQKNVDRRATRKRPGNRNRRSK